MSPRCEPQAIASGACDLTDAIRHCGSVTVTVPVAGWLADRFELVRHGDGANVASMEGMRGFAVFLVFLVHFATLVRPFTPESAVGAMLLNGFNQLGHSGVDLFFVLSGYLIYGALIARARPFIPYLKRRLWRIYPTFLAVFVVYVGLSLVVPSESKLPQDGGSLLQYLVVNLLLLPGIFPFEPMITVAWSLSYELFYYLLMPVVIALLQLRRWTPAARCAFFILISLATVIYCALYTGHVRLIMFLSGVLLWEALAIDMRLRLSDAMLLGALALSMAVAVFRPDGAAGYAVRTAGLFVGFLVLCYGCFTRPAGFVARCFALTPLRWLGNMSYSYYLIHGLALKAMFMVIGWLWLPTQLTWPWIAGLLGLTFAASLVPAAALYLVVERPWSLSKGGALAAPLRRAGALG